MHMFNVGQLVQVDEDALLWDDETLKRRLHYVGSGSLSSVGIIIGRDDPGRFPVEPLSICMFMGGCRSTVAYVYSFYVRAV